MLPPHIKAHQFSGEIPAENFPCTLEEKSKSVSFSRVYVCVKAKLTLVSFFFTIFSMHLSLIKCAGIWFLYIVNFLTNKSPRNMK